MGRSGASSMSLNVGMRSAVKWWIYAHTQHVYIYIYIRACADQRAWVARVNKKGGKEKVGKSFGNGDIDRCILGWGVG